ncbi:MAG: isoprenylcysteine carboxylmethyltransferase family protein [Hyphomonadaceae bacterium]
MQRNHAALGSAIFFFVAPGTVAGLLPGLITGWRQGGDASAPLTIVGALIALASLALLIECFIRFVRGGGTPAPIAPTERLVLEGSYRFVRNPMYVAVMGLVLGQVLIFASAALIAYAVILWLIFHVFVLGYEEPRLILQYGQAYLDYRDHVRRWIPRLTPWTPEPTDEADD